MEHDIFIFSIHKNATKKVLTPATSESELAFDEETGESLGYNNTEETANKCSKTSSSKLNGATCANFALLEQCPDDDSAGYWECLP